MLDAADSLDTTRNITCIEPYAERLMSILLATDDIELIERPVQLVPVERFLELGRGDLLFIDSTHIAKSGSDVLYLFNQVLPRLARGVTVHVHDIFWPFTYCSEWIQEGRDWTEAYLLRAFLTENSAWEIVLYNDWLWRKHPSEAASIRSGLVDRPGSIYLRKH